MSSAAIAPNLTTAAPAPAAAAPIVRAMTAVMVAIAGAAGVLVRYGIGRATVGTEALLWSTVAINLAGSFALGLLAASAWFSRDVREVIGVGFLGGFTTYSTFSVQVVLEADGGRTGTAVAYIAVSVVGGIALAAAGYALGRQFA
jgi:fluoride exporter